jgi:hypothetical protein
MKEFETVASLITYDLTYWFPDSLMLPYFGFDFIYIGIYNISERFFHWNQHQEG